MKSIVTKANIRWLVFIIFIYGLIQGLISVGVLDSYYQITLFTIGINIILAVSLNLIIGYAGQFSLGHAGFMAIGAYCTAIVLGKVGGTAGLLLGMLLGALVTAGVALIVAIPTLRLRGDYLAIATLGFAEVIRILIQNGGKLTGGPAGISNIPKVTNFTWLYVCIVLSIICIVNFARSTHGRATASVREDEIAAEAMGVNTTKYKTLAFVIGAVIASVGGALYAANFFIITPNTFNFQKSIDILVIVVFGGLGSLTGSIVASFVLGIITMMLQDYAAVRMIIYSIAIILIMIYRPSGLFGTKEWNINKISFKRKKGGKPHETSNRS